MKKLGLALLLCISWALAPAQAQAPVVPGTQKSIPVVGAITAGALLITGVAGQQIYLTSMELAPVATAVVQFIQGTGATCGTGSSALTGSMTFVSGQTWSQGSGYGAIMVLAPGNSLCIIITTAAAPGVLTYAQF